MKIICSIAVILFVFFSWSQDSEEVVMHLRESHKADLLDSTSGILNLEEIESFSGLDYFSFDSTYQIVADFEKDKGRRFKMMTSTDRMPVYRRFGYIHFTLNDSIHTLEVYQNMELRKNKEYGNYLFIPFRDSTSNIETYGGGRYIDIEIPEGETVLIDFNQAYNPYCAYSHRYSCPVPPKINFIKTRIEAGEKTPLAH